MKKISINIIGNTIELMDLPEGVELEINMHTTGETHTIVKEENGTLSRMVSECELVTVQ